MRVVRLLITTLLVLAPGFSARAEEPVNPERLFYAGNDSYGKGNYIEAIEEYGKIINSGYESANIYYNLGNAYFRAGKPGEAILNYERAKRLMPRDADCDANYKFVMSKIRGPVLPQRGMWEWRPLRQYYSSFTANGLLWISSGLYILVIVILLFAIYHPYAGRRFVITALLIFICLICNLFITWHKISMTGAEAIVIVPNVESHYGPSDSATVFFKLHEGMKVTVLKKKDDWYKIRRADGKIGWVHKEDLGIV